MSLLATGFIDLLLTNLVDILNAFSLEQSALLPTAAFKAERDRGAAPNAEELKSGPVVNLYASGSNPANSGASRDNDESTVMIQFDCYVAMLEDLDGCEDKAAYARLYYLLDQIRAAISDKKNFDFGMPVGTVGKRRWGRWQLSPQEEQSTMWICAASFTFEIDYSYESADLVMVDLEEISVDVKKQNGPIGPYSTLWAGLYPDLNV